jgi:peptidoglycan hydrolase-like protein with peptidoglycan-binding domain
VRSIQRVLNSLRGYNVKEDGLFGSETYNAIIKYQANNGLKQDGIVGKQTAVKLLSIYDKPSNATNSKIENGMKIAKEKTVNEIIQSELDSKEINSDTDYFIAVSKSQRQVYIYHVENNSWVNIKVFTCNIGSPDSLTIEGDFYSGLRGERLKIDETYMK